MRRAERAGEGNRTPIFGLGSQRLSHWTTPARVQRILIPAKVPLRRMRARVYWPVTVAAALLVGLLAYGLTTTGTDTTLDDAMARGERVAPPVDDALPQLGADGTSSLADFKGKVVLVNVWASWCEPCRDELPLIEKAHKMLSSRGGTVLGIDVKENSERGAEGRRRVRPHLPEPARPRRQLRAPVGPDRLPGELRASTARAAWPPSVASRSRRSGSTRRCRRSSTSRRDARAARHPARPRPRAPRRRRAGRDRRAGAARLAPRHRGRGHVPGVRHRAQRLQLRRGRPGARVHRRA